MKSMKTADKKLKKDEKAFGFVIVFFLGLLLLNVIAHYLGYGEQYRSVVKSLIDTVLLVLALFAVCVMAVLAMILAGISEAVKGSKNGTIRLVVNDDDNEPWRRSLRPDDEAEEDEEDDDKS